MNGTMVDLPSDFLESFKRQICNLIGNRKHTLQISANVNEIVNSSCE